MNNNIDLKVPMDDIRSLDLTYVVDSGETDYNKEGGKLLALCTILSQNDYITLELQNTSSEGDVPLTSNDLRDLADKLCQWADLSDKTL
jgi:hypothetical protein